MRWLGECSVAAVADAVQAVVPQLSGLPSLPDVVASSTDPLLLVTRRVAGASLFDVVDRIDRERAGAELAAFLAARPT